MSMEELAETVGRVDGKMDLLITEFRTTREDHNRRIHKMESLSWLVGGIATFISIMASKFSGGIKWAT